MGIKKNNTPKITEQQLLDNLAKICRDYSSRPNILAPKSPLFRELTDTIFNTIAQSRLLNLNMGLMSFDLYPLTGDPYYPPKNIDYFFFVGDREKDGYALYKFKFWNVSSLEKTKEAELEYKNILNGNIPNMSAEKDKLTTQLVLAEQTGRSLEARNPLVELQIFNEEEAHKREETYDQIFDSLAKDKLNIGNEITTTWPINFTDFYSIPAKIGFSFMKESESPFTEHEKALIRRINQTCSTHLKFDKKNHGGIYERPSMSEFLQQIRDSSEPLRKLLQQFDKLDSEDFELLRIIRSDIHKAIYPSLLTKPIPAPIEYHERKDISVDSDGISRKITALGFLERFYSEQLTFFGAKKDTLYQDQLTEIDPKLKQGVRGQVNALIRKNALYKGKPVPQFNEIVKPRHDRNTLIYKQLSEDDKQMIKKLHTIILEKERKMK